MTTHLVTIGTSLLGNARRHFGLAPSAPVPTADLDTFLAEAAPARASAETNSLHRALRPDDHLVLLPSDTDDGRACAAALERAYRRAGHVVTVDEVPGLAYDTGSFAERGLLGLAALLVHHTQSARKAKRDVRICATGGFKAEAAMATLVGLLFRAEVYYIHERFGDLVTLPPLPVSWDFAFAHDHRDLLEWLLEPRPAADVEDRLRGRPDALRTLLAPPGDDGTVELSAAGFVVLSAAYDRESAAASADIRLSSEARRVYNHVPDAFDDLLRKLGDPVLRDSQTERLQGLGGYVYPRGHRAERVLYDLDGPTVYVCLLLRGHARGSAGGDRYHAARRDGIQHQDFHGFERWTPPVDDAGGEVEGLMDQAAPERAAGQPKPSRQPSGGRGRQEPPFRLSPPPPRGQSPPNPKGSGRSIADQLSADVLRRLKGGS